MNNQETNTQYLRQRLKWSRVIFYTPTPSRSILWYQQNCCSIIILSDILLSWLGLQTVLDILQKGENERHVNSRKTCIRVPPKMVALCISYLISQYVSLKNVKYTIWCNTKSCITYKVQRLLAVRFSSSKWLQRYMWSVLSITKDTQIK